MRLHVQKREHKREKYLVKIYLKVLKFAREKIESIRNALLKDYGPMNAPDPIIILKSSIIILLGLYASIKP